MTNYILESLFENNLQKQSELVLTSDIEDSNDLIGIYFSGSYCPPCQKFTPILTDVYNKLQLLKSEQNTKKKLEIILVSSDKTVDKYGDYYSKMPWISLPYDRRDIKEKLCKQYEIKTIPQLIFLNSKTLEIVNKDGRHMIENNQDNIDYILKELKLN
jgi:nucleoredoxin